LLWGKYRFISEARAALYKAIEDAGHGYIIMPEQETRCGAVETIAEGKNTRRSLRQTRESIKVKIM
jgi:hypothetical protein